MFLLKARTFSYIILVQLSKPGNVACHRYYYLIHSPYSSFSCWRNYALCSNFGFPIRVMPLVSFVMVTACLDERKWSFHLLTARQGHFLDLIQKAYEYQQQNSDCDFFFLRILTWGAGIFANDIFANEFHCFLGSKEQVEAGQYLTVTRRGRASAWSSWHLQL